VAAWPWSYLAHDPRFKRDVAIKDLPSQFLHDPKFRGRFQREAEAITSLEHFTIVPMYDLGERDELPHLVMRYRSARAMATKPTDVSTQVLSWELDPLCSPSFQSPTTKPM